MSKVILGQRGDEAKSGGVGSGQADFQREVRRDIRNADARQIAATLTRDVVYPMLALNRGADSLRRCPRFAFDTGEPEDLATYAKALPDLVNIGMRIPVSWAHEKLRVPLPEGAEAVLVQAAAPAAPGAPGAQSAAPAATPLAALSANLPQTRDPTPVTALANRLQAESADAWGLVLDHIRALVVQADSLDGLQAALLAAYDGLPLDDLRQVMTTGFTVARLAGLSEVVDEAASRS